MDHYATLHELETVYSYEDVLNLVECIQVDRTNQALAQAAAARSHERAVNARNYRGS